MDTEPMIAVDASTSETAMPLTAGRLSPRPTSRRVDLLGAVCLALAVVCALVALSAAAVDEADETNSAAMEKRMRSFAFAKRAGGGDFGAFGGRGFAFARRSALDDAPQKRFDYGDFGGGGRSFAFAKRGSGEFGGRSFAFA